MKQSKLTPAIFLVLGALAYFCTRWVFTSSLDELGLIIPGTVPEILLWVLVAAAFVLAFVCAKKCPTAGQNNILSAIGELIYAVAAFTLTTVPAKGPATMVTLFQVSAYASVACLIASAVLRLMNKRPWYLLTLPVCLMAMLFLVECYQLWSEVPQLLEYVLGVGAVLSLVPFSFYRMARSANVPGKPWHNVFGFLSIFFCVGAASLGAYPLYLIGAALWIAADLTAALQEA